MTPAEVERHVQISRRMAAIIPAPRYALATFENYKPATKKQASALATARRFVQRVPWWESEAAGNLLLLGAPGTGKTHLAASVLHAAVADDIDAADDVGAYVFTSHAELMREWRAAVKVRTEAAFLQRYTVPLILVIDDVRQPRSADDVEGFEELAEARYRQITRPMVLTSNLNVSLLREGALLAVLDGVSHRARHGWEGQPVDDEDAQP